MSDMTTQQYLERLEEALLVGDRVLIQMKFSGQNAAKPIKEEAIRTHETLLQATRHLATLLRDEIAGTHKSVPCVGIHKAVVNMQKLALSYWSYEVLEKWYKLSITAAPSRLEEIIGEKDVVSRYEGPEPREI